MPTRFNPPPGWPPAPPGWTPPPGWQPDPSWPPAPPGWPLWVEDARAGQSPIVPDSLWMIGGGAALFVGAFLPFISSPDYAYVSIHTGARITSALFGLILAGLGYGLRSSFSKQTGTKGKALGIGIPALVLALLGTLGYLIFTAIGEAGYQEATGFGVSQKVSFSPSIGIILSIAGCIAVVIGSIRVIRHSNS